MAPPNRGRRAQRTAPTPPPPGTTTTATYFINPSTWDGLLRTHTTPTVLPNGEKPAKIFSTKVNFTSFSMLQVSVNLHNFRFRLLALHIQNLWNHCIQKYDPTISRIFWIPFWRFFWIWPNCGAAAAWDEKYKGKISLASRNSYVLTCALPLAKTLL